MHTLNYFLAFVARDLRFLDFTDLLAVYVLGNYSFVKFLVDGAPVRLVSKLVSAHNLKTIEAVITVLDLPLHLFEIYFSSVVFNVCKTDLPLLLHQPNCFTPDLFLRPSDILSLLCHYLVQSRSFSESRAERLTLLSYSLSLVV